MGCDIHFHVERQSPDGTWLELAGPEGVDRWDRWYGGRNYSLFAMLADVRNGTGFAGSDRGDRITPIDDPRGLPEDVSPTVRAESDSWGVDGHSHSYFGLDELLAVDWDQPITHRCWIRRRRDLDPDPRYPTPEAFTERIQDAANYLGELPSAQAWGYETCGWSSEGQGESGWRTIQWTERWSTAVGTSWFACLLRMARYSNGDPSRVRAVFWFDN